MRVHPPTYSAGSGMRIANGLRIGGMVRHDLAAYSIAVPLLSFRRPGRMCWLWLLEWRRHRTSSGVRHRFFRIVRLPGHQARTIVDLFWLGSFEFVWQHDRGAE